LCAVVELLGFTPGAVELAEELFFAWPGAGELCVGALLLFFCWPGALPELPGAAGAAAGAGAGAAGWFPLPFPLFPFPLPPAIALAVREQSAARAATAVPVRRRFIVPFTSCRLTAVEGALPRQRAKGLLRYGFEARVVCFSGSKRGAETVRKSFDDALADRGGVLVRQCPLGRLEGDREGERLLARAELEAAVLVEDADLAELRLARGAQCRHHVGRGDLFGQDEREVLPDGGIRDDVDVRDPSRDGGD